MIPTSCVMNCYVEGSGFVGHLNNMFPGACDGDLWWSENGGGCECSIFSVTGSQAAQLVAVQVPLPSRRCLEMGGLWQLQIGDHVHRHRHKLLHTDISIGIMTNLYLYFYCIFTCVHKLMIIVCMIYIYICGIKCNTAKLYVGRHQHMYCNVLYCNVIWYHV